MESLLERLRRRLTEELGPPRDGTAGEVWTCPRARDVEVRVVKADGGPPVVRVSRVGAGWPGVLGFIQTPTPVAVEVAIEMLVSDCRGGRESGDRGNPRGGANGHALMWA